MRPVKTAGVVNVTPRSQLMAAHQQRVDELLPLQTAPFRSIEDKNRIDDLAAECETINVVLGGSLKWYDLRYRSFCHSFYGGYVRPLWVVVSARALLACMAIGYGVGMSIWLTGL